MTFFRYRMANLDNGDHGIDGRDDANDNNNDTSGRGDARPTPGGACWHNHKRSGLQRRP
jgi:hypothetical protein